MCGIVGVVKVKSDHQPLNGMILEHMTNSISHRGPNDMGAVGFVGKKILQIKDSQKKFETSKFDHGFGHRRLSILDLSSMGRQPMSDSAKMFWLTFNGEIYNYIEIREVLVRKGYFFRTQTDSEVILHSYMEWGVDCFKKFNGMWALAIYDRRQEKVILSRDRLGKKPLYFTFFKGNLLFASEVKALKRVPGLNLKPNKKKIINYAARHYRYVDNDEESFFEGISQVPKSSYMLISCNNNPQTHKYWNLETKVTEEKISDADAIQRFKELFIDSIRIRLRSDVPLALNLSGGLDSTSITCSAAKELGVNVRTFSGITGKGRFDESEYIDEVVNEIDAEHTYLYPEPSDLIPTIERMLHFHDEPICTITWYSLFQISENISKAGIPVVLTGHGGDELLGGYWDHYHYNFTDLRKTKELSLLNDEETAWFQNHARDPKEMLLSKEFIEKSFSENRNEINHFSRYLDVISPEATHFIDHSFPDYKYSDGYLNRRLYLELLYETVPASLHAEDRNTMAFSVESRIPFLDYRLIEFAFSLPNRFKIRKGLGKWLLRESMKGILPEKVRTRKDKAGFVAPASDWFKTKNRSEIKELLHSDHLKSLGIFNQERILNYFDEHVTNKHDHHMIIWNWINLAIWAKMFN